MVNSVSGGNNIASQYSGLMRVNGMASGMDIDGMVNKLMTAARIPLDKMNQNKQILEWQQADYHDMNTSLEDFDLTIFNGISMQSTFNKKTVTSSDESKVIATAINVPNNITSSISVSQLATASSWTTKGTNNKVANYKGLDTTLNFLVKKGGTSTPISITIAAKDTVEDVAAKLTSSNLGVTAMVENIDDGTGTYVKTLVLTNNKTGSGWTIETNDAGTNSYMKNSLGFAFDPINPNQLAPDSNHLGKDAIVSINGYQMTKDSNNFTVNGVSYTLKGLTNTTGPDIPINISTATDVDSIFNSVKAFVDKYNDIIKKFNDKNSETRNRDYQPLTDTQKQGMTDTQVQQWEDKAKSGLIKNDSILSGVLNNMRQDIYSPVTGSNITSFKQIADIGITTSSNYSDNGKLVIDETKLRDKIQEDPNAIYQLFNSDGDTYNTKGIVGRLRDSISDAEKKIQDKAGYTPNNVLLDNSQYVIGKSLNDLKTQISDFEQHLTDNENRYYSQFTAMEQAMQQANQQSAYFSQQFGGQ